MADEQAEVLPPGDEQAHQQAGPPFNNFQQHPGGPNVNIGAFGQQPGGANMMDPHERAQLAKEQRQNEYKFMEIAPKFNVGELQWDIYMDHFLSVARSKNVIREEVLKLALYNSMRGQALKMVTPRFNPAQDPNAAMGFYAYASLIGEVFEPKAESEAAKLAFESRVQQIGEHPMQYYLEKLALFERAFKSQIRDYNYLYQRVIKGLVNQEMKHQLRYKIPTPVHDTNQFKESLVFVANVVRRMYMDGEISEADALGAEAFATIPSYNYNKIETTLGKAVKVEGVHAVNTNGMNKGKGKCYHCGSKDHFIAQCSRKAAGLPAAVQAIQLEEAVEAVGSQQPQQFKKTFYPKKIRKPGFQSFKPGNRSNKQNPKKFNKRVMYVYEDDQGESFCEPVSDTDENQEQEGDEVNAVLEENEEGHSEADFIPGVFLGKTQ